MLLFLVCSFGPGLGYSHGDGSYASVVSPIDSCPGVDLREMDDVLGSVLPAPIVATHEVHNANLPWCSRNDYGSRVRWSEGSLAKRMVFHHDNGAPR